MNVAVSLDALKADYKWSDEDLYRDFLYDLQVQHVVGYDSLTEGDSEPRALYNFLRHLSQHNLAHSSNLLAAARADITDQQLTALTTRTGQQRMNSTQKASNIVIMSWV